MDRQAQAREVDANYDFFQRHLASILRNHRHQYVLIRNQRLIDYFDDVGDAYRAGLKRFADGIFSIQEVTDEPVDLGIFSHAGN
ncbi:hypothetical protein [Sphingomonas cavernae]|uniref:DUF5678 domain-containing protein n=1 Tax=Sphingomonas cavernae TaxID=2320861 RepID=A0A418WR31_9SPHN|nr:hypothetical protein [Sphingomonas cavernae]RJF93703.1 hypothetical protein D3876_05235 [Sphingomonas cavernae]